MEFASLKVEMDRNKQPKVARESWIPKETWKMADRRAVLQRSGKVNTREVCKVRRNFSVCYRRTDDEECKHWG